MNDLDSGTLYGTISLVVDGKQISQFIDHVFDRGTSIMSLENMGLLKSLVDTQGSIVAAPGSLYPLFVPSDEVTCHVSPPTEHV